MILIMGNFLNMINEIKITDLSEAESYAFGPNNKYDIWISATDEQDKHKVRRMKKLLNNKGVKHHYEFFYDWSDEDGVEWDHLEINGPQLKHVENIINFLKPFVEDDKVHNLGVNCFAGVSRSTAIGIIASVMSGKTPYMAFDYIKTVRPMAWPNLRILRFASDILKQDLKTTIENWKRTQKGVLYTGGWSQYEE